MLNRKSILTLCLFVAAVSSHQNDLNSIGNNGDDLGNIPDLDLGENVGESPDRSKFHSWVEKYEKVYESAEEEIRRMLIWLKNHELIEKHNNQVPAPSYSLGHNQFSDLTEDEFLQFNFLGEYGPDSIDSVIEQRERAQAKFIRGNNSDESVKRRELEKWELSKDSLPDSVNWIQKGAVTKPKNQGQCGACWAFSTTGGIEGAKFIKDGQLVSLSEQNLVDCDKTDKGCLGGIMEQAFVFDEDSKGLCSEEDYPYLARKGECNSTCVPVAGTIVSKYIDIDHDENSLMASIANQPTCIAIHAGVLGFQFYSSGVFDNAACGNDVGTVDHGVLAVGYGTDQETGKEYWTVKNSWGESWGENGYIRMARESTHEYGTCNIYRLPSVPIM